MYSRRTFLTSAGAVLGAVSQVLCEKTPAQRFVTMFLFQLAPNGEVLNLVGLTAISIET